MTASMPRATKQPLNPSGDGAMQWCVRSQAPWDAATYSMAFVRVGAVKVCPSGGIAGSAKQGAIVGALTTNDFTHVSPSHDNPDAIGFVDVHIPSQFIGGSKGVTTGNEGS
jgi:hypothetical protein